MSGSQSQFQEPFAALPDGRPVAVYTLANAHGLEVRVITYGATLVSLETPDRNGRLDDLVLGYHDLAGYLRDTSYFGGTIGRYANRIAGGRFDLDGRTYRLATNDGPNHLHGGLRGFHTALWDAEPFAAPDRVGLRLRHLSPDGDEGYPGNLAVVVEYALTAADELVIDYTATTDRATPVSLTHHSYFNLAGAGGGDVLAHRLAIDADHFTPVDGRRIPDGSLAPVAGTPLDFRSLTPIGARIDDDHEQLRGAHGYDHNFVLRSGGAGLAHAARVEDPRSGRSLDIWTTEPGLQFYSGNYLHGEVGKGGRAYGRRHGLCLEPQRFPDSPNRPQFPSCILRPGGEYRSRTVFAFGVTA
jgi:aldose 1-epimerase